MGDDDDDNVDDAAATSGGGGDDRLLWSKRMKTRTGSRTYKWWGARPSYLSDAGVQLQPGSRNDQPAAARGEDTKPSPLPDA